MLSHLDENGQPGMVDVSDKTVTKRTAVAQALVALPDEARALFQSGDLQTKKGPVFQTAIIAGVSAAKKTWDLIPLCHPIAMENCKIAIAFNDAGLVEIRCTASATHKTGVEMEALTGATVAALTVYDMCKALSHGIVIQEIKLVEKTGGKRDFHA